MFKISATTDRIWRGLPLNYIDVLMVHGQGQDAETWLTGYFVGQPLPLKLVDLGYTVWMANNRGTKFSKNMNVSD
jgi:pimeloyl-ACP methyl ester carboxylesterase